VEAGYDIQWRPPAQFVAAIPQDGVILITGIFQAPATPDQPILWVKNEGEGEYLFGECSGDTDKRRIGQVWAAVKVKKPGQVFLFAKCSVNNSWSHAFFQVPVETTQTVRPDDVPEPSIKYIAHRKPYSFPEKYLGSLSDFDGASTSIRVRGSTKKRKLDEQSSVPVGGDPMQIDVLPIIDLSLLPPNATELYQDIIVAGDIYAQQIRKYSDQRLKTDIEPIQGSLSGLLGLRGVSYLWNSLVKGGDGKRVYGLIAQEVEQYFPHAVRETNGTLTVDYTDLIAVLVEGIKELNSTVEDLKARTDEHSTRLDVAEAQLAQIERYPTPSLICDTGVPSKRDRMLRSPNLDRARDLILQRNNRDVRISLVGAGGAGKSTLARQLIDDDAVRSRFQKRIVWLNLLLEDDSISAIRKLHELILTKADFEDPIAILQQRIRDSLFNATLIVVDNVWNSGIVSAIIDCGFKGIVVTTRHANICDDVDDLLLDLFDDHLALQFFPEQDRAPVALDSKAITEIISRCKGLPLALDAVSRSRKSTIPLSWDSIARNLSKFMKSAGSNPVYAAFDTSMNNLPDDTRRRLESFAVFPKGPISLHHLAICWNLADSADALAKIESCPEDLLCPGSDLFELSQNSLVSFTRSRNVWQAQVHDLFHDYLLDLLSGSIKWSCFQFGRRAVCSCSASLVVSWCFTGRRAGSSNCCRSAERFRGVRT
jgi:hypothetical protein